MFSFISHFWSGSIIVRVRTTSRTWISACLQTLHEVCQLLMRQLIKTDTWRWILWLLLSRGLLLILLRHLKVISSSISAILHLVEGLWSVVGRASSCVTCTTVENGSVYGRLLSMLVRRLWMLKVVGRGLLLIHLVSTGLSRSSIDPSASIHRSADRLDKGVKQLRSIWLGILMVLLRMTLLGDRLLVLVLALLLKNSIKDSCQLVLVLLVLGWGLACLWSKSIWRRIQVVVVATSCFKGHLAVQYLRDWVVGVWLLCSLVEIRLLSRVTNLRFYIIIFPRLLVLLTFCFNNQFFVLRDLEFNSWLGPGIIIFSMVIINWDYQTVLVGSLWRVIGVVVLLLLDLLNSLLWVLRVISSWFILVQSNVFLLLLLLLLSFLYF